MQKCTNFDFNFAPPIQLEVRNFLAFDSKSISQVSMIYFLEFTILHLKQGSRLSGYQNRISNPDSWSRRYNIFLHVRIGIVSRILILKFIRLSVESKESS